MKKFRKPSDSFLRMVSPDRDLSRGRKSLGMEDSVGEFFYIKLDLLIPFRNQSRVIFDQDELDLLADSIKNYGIRQPLSIVRSSDNPGKFEIVSGERRAKAAKIAGLDKVPCIIIENYKDAETAALIENIHRSDLHPVELAKAYKILLDSGSFSTQEECSRSLGINSRVFRETMSVLDLPEEVQNFLMNNNIRNRDDIRVFLKSKNPLNLINKDQPIVIPKQKAVMRISMKEGDFSVQKQAISKLTDEEKSRLKVLLEDILKEL